MMHDKMIRNLEEKGFKRWQKGNFDRLYINATALGLECTYYNTGNISGAWFDGERISNCQARRYKAAKTYIDVATGELHSDIPALEKAATRLMEEADYEYACREEWRPGDAPWNAPGMRVADFVR